MRKINVLIAEDIPVILKILARYVTEFTNGNANIDLAEKGTIALKYVEDGNKYDLVILNIEMPGMFGHEVGARIRKLGYKGPIIGHTGHSDDEAKWYMIEGKMNAIITRPDTGAGLYKVMSEFNLCSNKEPEERFQADFRECEMFESIQRNPNLKL